ncbi:hypothetical protein ACJW30_02G007600 [Castanea mollissima]
MSVCINVYSHLSENFHPSLDIARNLTTNHCVVIPQTNNIHKLFFFFLSQLQLGKRLECFMAKIVKFPSLYRLKMTCKSQLNAVLIGQCDMDPTSTFNCMWNVDHSFLAYKRQDICNRILIVR